MELSFTGIVYFPITLALLILAFRFYKEWHVFSEKESLVYFYIFILFALVSLAGVLAGTVFTHNPDGIRWMLIISAYLLSVAIGLFGYLVIFYRFRIISPWFGFFPIFIFGVVVSTLTLLADIHPELEPSGGIYWGMPLYINFLRFLLYIIGLIPLIYVLITQKVKKVHDREAKTRYFLLTSFFGFLLAVVFVDFILEPIFEIKALTSELTILLLLAIFTGGYFYFMERVIAKSERRFRRLVENMSDMICLINPEGVIEYANPAQIETLGLPEELLIGRPILSFVHEEDRELVRKFINDKRNSNAERTVEFRFNQRNGQPKWVETAGFFFLDSEKEIGASSKLVMASRDLTERKIAEERLSKSLEEKKILISEIYHRVKNNMATVIGLLNIQAASVKDKQAKSILMDTKNRIFSMSLVHQLLYQRKDLSAVNFKEYIEKLVSNLSRVFHMSDQIAMHLDLEEINLNLEIAVPCGLIIHEVITNSFKHAFCENCSGNLFIETRTLGENFYQMKVRDDGAGFDLKIKDELNESLGLKLMQSLAQQIEGNVEIKNNNGTEVTVTFRDRQTNFPD